MKDSTQNRTSVLATRGYLRRRLVTVQPVRRDELVIKCAVGRACPRREHPRPLDRGQTFRAGANGGSGPQGRRRQSTRLAPLGLALAHAVPTLGWDIRGSAERQPDGTHGLASLDGLLRRATAHFLEHEIAREHAAVRLPVFVGDGQPEFAQSHASTLGENRRCKKSSTNEETPRSDPRRFNHCTSAAANLRCIRRPGRPEQCLGWEPSPR
jgi:hypothetical protein